MKMTAVTYEQYGRVVRQLPHDWSRPITGERQPIAAMQWVNPNGDVVAQAVYHAGRVPEYYTLMHGVMS